MAFKMNDPSLYKKPVGPRATQKPVDHMTNNTLEEVLHNKHAEKNDGTIEEQRKLREKNKNKKSGAPFKGANSKNSKCWKGCRKVGTKPSPTRPGVTVNDCKCD